MKKAPSWLYAALGGIAAAIVLALLSEMMLKFLGEVLKRLGENEWGEIFSQLQDAVIEPPLYLTLPLSVLGALVIRRIGRWKLLGWFVLLSALSGVTLFFTRVNGIMVCDVAVSLARMASAGAL